MSDRKERRFKSVWARIRRQKSKLVIKKQAQKDKKEATERLSGSMQRVPKKNRCTKDVS